jgi:predicted MFS family arabinose efflux permease
MISPNQRLVSKNNPLLVLLIIIGLWTLADALIAYISPIIISETVKNTFLFGIIISLSSVAGLIFDVIAGEKYENKGFKFFTYLTFVVSILFPIVLLISTSKRKISQKSGG